MTEHSNKEPVQIVPVPSQDKQKGLCIQIQREPELLTCLDKVKLEVGFIHFKSTHSLGF